MRQLWRYEAGWPEFRHRVTLQGSRVRRTLRVSVVTGMALILLACGATLASLVSKAQKGLRAATPLVDTLVAQGVIPAERAAEIKQDFSDAVDVTGVLATDLQAAGDDKALKSAAVRKAAAGWRAIYQRNHFGVNPQILRVANIVDAIFASLELFYGGTPAPGANLPAGPRPQTEQELKKQIERQIDELNSEVNRR